MAIFNTALYSASRENRANPSRLAEANINSGEIEFAVIPYTLLGTEAAADVINLMVLPKDCIPCPHHSSIVCATDPGTALTFNVGTAATPAGWGASVALTVQGSVGFVLAGGTMPAWLAPTQLPNDAGSGNAVLQAVITTATALTPGTVIYFMIGWKRGR